MLLIGSIVLIAIIAVVSISYYLLVVKKGLDKIKNLTKKPELVSEVQETQSVDVTNKPITGYDPQSYASYSS